MNQTRSSVQLDANNFSAHSQGIRICDVTLRDGEQAADVAFDIDEKVKIAALLEETGVHQVQVGLAHLDGPQATRGIKKSGLDVPVELLCMVFRDNWRDEIKSAIDAGADVIQVLMRSSDKLLNILGISREEAIDRTSESISYAIDKGAGTVVYGTSFSTQADRSFLDRLNIAATSAGAMRLTLADSMGVSSPATFADLVTHVVSSAEIPVGIHCHNDFSLGVACTLAGLGAGASWADVSVNGIGERSGNASLESTVAALQILYGADLGIDTRQLCALSATVADVLHRDLPANQPVVGGNAFAQKLDVHVRVSTEAPELFEPYDPELVGNRRRLRLGKGSGPYAVGAKCHELGARISEENLHILVAQVNESAESKKGYVTDEAFLRMIEEVAARK